MSTIRIEAEGTSDLGRVHAWMDQHRGAVVQLDATKRLQLGTPISGARAVIVSAVLQDDARPGPQLGGVVRVLSNPTGVEPARLVFEGRSPAGLTSDEAEAAAAELLREFDARIATDTIESMVA